MTRILLFSCWGPPFGACRAGSSPRSDDAYAVGGGMVKEIERRLRLTSERVGKGVESVRA